MSHSIYLLLLMLLILISIAIAVVANYRKNSHTQLYKDGVRNENEGDYKSALESYEEALTEIRKLKVDNKFAHKIEERIKILHTIIDYEKNFHTSRPVNK